MFHLESEIVRPFMPLTVKMGDIVPQKAAKTYST